MTAPADPIAAVTHRDPYTYYAELVARRPLYRDAGLGLWVASSAAAVDAVLSSAAGRVRPPSEPVPAALVGSPAGAIFGRLVRMNDGASHAPYKPAIAASLQSVAAAVERHARDCARQLDPTPITAFMFDLSAHAVAALLGVPQEARSAVAAWTGDFVRAIAPGATAEQLARGKAAAGDLLALFDDLLQRPGDGLFARLAREAADAPRDVVRANAIGFLSQAYEATAGLIGNTLLALARMPALRAAPLPDVVREVARYDSPVHNTRRFLAADERIAGQDMRAGEAILVLLAAANRDPAANADPTRFDPHRAERRSFTFGHGVHACPGETIATAIAVAGVARLLESGTDLERLAGDFSYRTSANTRIPLFA